MHLVAEHRGGDRAADDSRGDVVEERGQHEDHHQQHEAALPVVGQPVRQYRGNLAPLEVVRKQCETEQQAEQIGEDHPLMQQVQAEPGEARALLEAGETELVEDDRRKARQRDLQRALVEHGDASERRTEQQELDRDQGRAQSAADSRTTSASDPVAASCWRSQAASEYLRRTPSASSRTASTLPSRAACGMIAAAVSRISAPITLVLRSKGSTILPSQPKRQASKRLKAFTW